MDSPGDAFLRSGGWLEGQKGLVQSLSELSLQRFHLPGHGEGLDLEV